MERRSGIHKGAGAGAGAGSTKTDGARSNVGRTRERAPSGSSTEGTGGREGVERGFIDQV
eukprot:5617285-Pyramimonas_sp.AAC.1